MLVPVSMSLANTKNSWIGWVALVAATIPLFAPAAELYRFEHHIAGPRIEIEKDREEDARKEAKTLWRKICDDWWDEQWEVLEGLVDANCGKPEVNELWDPQDGRKSVQVYSDGQITLNPRLEPGEELIVLTDYIGGEMLPIHYPKFPDTFVQNGPGLSLMNRMRSYQEAELQWYERRRKKFKSIGLKIIYMTSGKLKNREIESDFSKGRTRTFLLAGQTYSMGAIAVILPPKWELTRNFSENLFSLGTAENLGLDNNHAALEGRIRTLKAIEGNFNSAFESKQNTGNLFISLTYVPTPEYNCMRSFRKFCFDAREVTVYTFSRPE
jgi:hypothetical protein